MAIKKFNIDADDATNDTPLSMREIREEFGGNKPDSFSEYYLGEGLVSGIDFAVTESVAYANGVFMQKNGDNDYIIKGAPFGEYTVSTTTTDEQIALAVANDGAVIKTLVPAFAGRRETQYVTDPNPVPGTDPVRYKVKYRDTDNLVIPSKGFPVAFSDFYGTEKADSIDVDNGDLTVVLDEGLFNGVEYGMSLQDAFPKFHYPNIDLLEILQSINSYNTFGDQIEKITFIVPEHVTFISEYVNEPAIKVSGVLPSIHLQFIVKGRILGRGGDGGDAKQNKSSAARNGQNGGDALAIDHDGEVTITMQQDENATQLPAIMGGGGGGAAGWYQAQNGDIFGTGGGGGAGAGRAGKYNINNRPDDGKLPSYNHANTAGVTAGMTTFPNVRVESPATIVSDWAGSTFSDMINDIGLKGDDGIYTGDREILSHAGRSSSMLRRYPYTAAIAQNSQQGGAGGTIITESWDQPFTHLLPYTKPSYINEYNESTNTAAPALIHNVPAGFTNGWIVGHIDSTGKGFCAVVEEGVVIWSDYVNDVREIEGVAIHYASDFEAGVLYHPTRVIGYYKTNGTFKYQNNHWTNKSATNGNYGTRSWTQSDLDAAVVYKRVTATMGAHSNRTNTFASGGINTGSANAFYRHGGGFTKNNNTSSSGDRHKYLYYQLEKRNMGHKVARTRLGSINFVTGDVSYASTYAIIGTGAHGGVQPYPSNNVSYSYKARYFPINMHQAHKNNYFVSVGGYGSNVGEGGKTGVGTLNGVFPPTYAIDIADREFNDLPTYGIDLIGGGGAGGGAFGFAGGDATAYYWNALYLNRGDLALVDVATGGQPGSAIKVNSQEHLNNSTLPTEYTRGEIEVVPDLGSSL